MHDLLLSIIARKVTFSAADVALCKAYFEPVTVARQGIIERSGKVPNYLFFIASGYARLYYHDDRGDEVTTHIGAPMGFVTPYLSFINQTAAKENVECITECELLRMSRANLLTSIQTSDRFRDFSTIVFEQAIAYNENRANDLATLTAEQRYNKLIGIYPSLLANVPLQHIASFLGMKPESLSRIRKQRAN